VGRVTLNDVGRAAGVSRATASLVVRGNSRIPKETADRVRQAMEDLGYVYDRRAANLRESRSMTLGLVLTDIRNPYFAEMTMAFEETVHPDGYTVVVGYSRDEFDRERQLVSMMVERRVDGLVLLPAQNSQPQVLDRLVDGSQTSLVLVARHFDDQHSYVGPDNRRAGYLVSEHLRSIGARSMVLVGGPQVSSARTERVEGMLEGAQGEIRFDPRRGAYSATNQADGAAAMAVLLDHGQLPDAVVAYSDVVALGAYTELRRRGIEAGRDVAVASFDDIEAAEQQVPSLTSVATFPDVIGRRSAEVLMARLAGEASEPTRVVVDPVLRVRASTGTWRPRR
jgi:LacI family transcriptional regulator